MLFSEIYSNFADFVMQTLSFESSREEDVAQDKEGHFRQFSTHLLPVYYRQCACCMETWTLISKINRAISLEC